MNGLLDLATNYEENEYDFNEIEQKYKDSQIEDLKYKQRMIETDEYVKEVNDDIQKLIGHVTKDNINEQTEYIKNLYSLVDETRSWRHGNPDQSADK